MCFEKKKKLRQRKKKKKKRKEKKKQLYKLNIKVTTDVFKVIIEVFFTNVKNN